ncbi:MAG: TetR/AcrR family transcriptional regulator [Bifidobacterium tibiigranuli]|jgi:AcrR family transcriptional regulator|nr:TetR/AcrR family transcriptional regulator [Bifidobacterium tibiigranuli]MCH3975103.1 TetR/AcrR family transcriptional regulator [Bifidobacterium tibiigranuli]MCH4190470.1 TetR/AcrR family transcriptional regulator [Bifidobacterium tibiigranuli]MCH4202861.1 TetR/AcrR family transcriptional regulator [Bifidobacterium tibiigranuli]MCH4274887.1 TetR/AcrR family transcriptional regulator [Bifidobacterium tibiigranuli]MCI1792364.1 TetR/AcrR family transcriptional regulator [Bifidobacterium tibii
MTARGSETRQRIVDQAVRDIREHGYGQVSLRSLAAELGLTTGSVYRHFASKEELLNAAGYEMSRIVNDAVVPSRASVDTTGSDVEILLGIADRLLQLMRDDPYDVEFLFFGPLYGTAMRQPGAVEQPRFLATLLGICARLCERYDASVDPNQLFVQIWAFIQGYGNLIMRGVADYDASMLREALMRLLSKPSPESLSFSASSMPPDARKHTAK